MKRRAFIAWLGGAAVAPLAFPRLASAQQRGRKIPRIGIIDDGPFWSHFRQAMHEAGYVDGKTIAYAYRTANGNPERLTAAANELARLPVDVIATYGTPASRAAKAATSTIPIVVISVGDPVAAGLVRSLAQPGGNVTGNTILAPDLSPKRLQLVKEIIPSAHRAALLWNPDNVSNTVILEQMRAAAPALGLAFTAIEARNAGDLEGAFATLKRERPDAVLLTSDPVHQSNILQDHRRAEPARPARHVSEPRQRRRRRADVLWRELPGSVPGRRRLRAEDPAGHQARRPTGAAAGPLRAGDQPEDRQGDGAEGLRRGARPRRRGDRMRRRAFLLLAGAATGWPVAARAQQKTMPVIGWLSANSSDTNAYQLRGFRQGLKEAGFAEGENVALEYRWAANQLNRLPALAAELVRRRVAVIAAGAPPAAVAAKAASTTIPVVFVMAQDPVRLGLVGSLARPGGNLTGVNFLTSELAAKRLQLLHELVPGAKRVAVLVNPDNAATTETNLRETETAAHALGLQLRVLTANTSGEIDAAFAEMARERPDALYVSSGPYFTGRRIQLVHLATRHAIPAIFGNREHSEVGGLMSYGANISDGYRQMGVYAGRLLKGTKPADLPILQADKFELIINAQTAKILGVAVPPSLLARADEVIE